MKSVAGAVRTYLAKYHKGSGMTAACVCVCCEGRSGQVCTEACALFP